MKMALRVATNHFNRFSTGGLLSNAYPRAHYFGKFSQFSQIGAINRYNQNIHCNQVLQPRRYQSGSAHSQDEVVDISKMSYPSDFVHGLLSAHCASETGKEAGNSKVKTGDLVKFSTDSSLSQLLQITSAIDLNTYMVNWRVQDVIDDRDTGYLGIVYENSKDKQTVLAHRSTNFALGLTTRNIVKQSGVQADIESVLMGRIVMHQAYGFVATHKAIETVRANQHILSVTGHSLGAWLANLSVYYCNTALKHNNVKGVTFDGPGAYEMMKQMSASDIRGAGATFNARELDIVSYFSAPNIVNCTNTHIGRAYYRLFPEIDSSVPEWLMRLTGEKNLDALSATWGHDLKYILPFFNAETGRPEPGKYKKVEKWPSIKHADYGNSVKPAIDASLLSTIGTRFGKGIMNTLSSIVFGQQTTTLGSLAYFSRDWLKGRIKQDQFWKAHQYLSRSQGYAATPQDKIEEFGLLYEGQYRVEVVNEYEERVGDAIDKYLMNIKLHERAILNSASGTLHNDLAHIIKLYDYKLSNDSIVISEKHLTTTISQLRDKMRIILNKHKGELDKCINAAGTNEVQLRTYIALARHKSFISRTEQLDEVTKLHAEQQVVVVSGMGGVGKSTFAAEYSHIMHDQGAIVRWINGDGKLETGYRSIAEELNIDIKAEKSVVIGRVYAKLATTPKQCILVLDNIKDYEEVRDYLIDVPKNVSILITTRKHNLNSELAEVVVNPFTNEQGLSLIVNTLKVDKDQAQKLLTTVCELPLRLRLAVAYIADKTNLTSIAGYIAKYESLKKSDSQIIPAMEIVLEKVMKAGGRNWEVLHCCAYLDPDFIPIKLLNHLGLSESDLQNVTKALEAQSLAEVTINSDGEYGLRIHRFIQKEVIEYARLHQDTIKTREEDVLNELLGSLVKLMPEVTENPDERWQVAKLYANTVKNILVHANKYKLVSDNVSNLQTKLGRYYTYIKSMFKEALFYDEQALSITKELHIGNHPDVAMSLDNVGSTYHLLRETHKSLDYLEQALVMRRALYPGNHPDVATSLNNVGLAYKDLGEAHKSLDYLEQALVMRRALYPGNHPDVLNSLNNIGLAYHLLGETHKALEYYEQSLVMKRALYPGNHPDVAGPLINAGMAYQDLGKTSKGLEYIEQSLDMFKALYPGNHPYVATSLNNIGLAYYTLGEIRKGLEYLEQSLSMCKALYPGNYPDSAASLYNVGRAYQDLGENRKGLEYLEQALDMFKALYPGNHPYVAKSLSDVGRAYKDLGETRKGLEYLEQALSMYKALYPGNHPTIATLLNNIGLAYKDLGEPRKGLEYLEKALSMLKELYIGNHPDVASSLNNIGLAYIELGQTRKGLEYLEQALGMYKELYPGNHPDVANSLNNVGLTYKDLGEPHKGLEYFEQALSMFKALYPSNHPHVARSLNNVGMTYQDLGEAHKGLEYLEMALGMYKALYPGNHPHVAAVINNVGGTYQDLGEPRKALEYQEQALSMYKALYPGNHPDVARSLNKAGNTYQDLGETRKGLEYLEQALSMYKALYPGNHPTIATLLNNIGLAYKGEPRKALEYQEQALSMYKELYTGNHPSIAIALTNIGSVYYDLGETSKGLEYFEQAYTMHTELFGTNYEKTLLIKQHIELIDKDFFNKPGKLSKEGADNNTKTWVEKIAKKDNRNRERGG